MANGDTSEAKSEAPKVKVVKKERKLKVFDGTEGAKGFRIWKEEALSAIESLGYTGKDAGKHLYDYLGPDCKREIKLAQGESARNSANDLLTALATIYGDQRTLAQRRTAFYNCKQKENENILEFSHRMLAELEAVAELDTDVKAATRTSMLNDQFAENVRHRQLRWELKKRKDDADIKTFKDLRQVALDWSDELSDQEPEGSRPKHSRSARADAQLPSASGSSFSPEIENRFQKIEGQLEQHSSALSTMLHQQQEMINQLKEIKIAGSGSRNGSGRRCYHCGEPGHFKRDCPARQGQGNGQTPAKPVAQSGGRY